MVSRAGEKGSRRVEKLGGWRAAKVGKVGG